MWAHHFSGAILMSPTNYLVQFFSIDSFMALIKMSEKKIFVSLRVHQHLPEIFSI